MKNLIYVWLCAALAAVMFCGCSKPSEGNKPGPKGARAKEMLPVAVRTAIVEPGEISEMLQFTGELESPLSVQLSARMQGRLDKLELKKGVEVTEGVEVKQGDVVAEIEHRDLEAQLKLAKAQVQQGEVALADKERERRRLEALFAEEVATEQARDAAVAAHESAKAALAQAEAQQKLAKVNLDESFIRAPMDAVVAERYVDPGAMVGASTPIVRLVQMTPLRLMVSVPARMLPALQPGVTPVEVKTDVYPDRVFTCLVSRIFPTVDPATRTAPVEILLDNKRSGGDPWLLRPGMYATAEVRMAMRETALMVPASSVIRVLDRQVVFVLEGSTARAATVRTGIRSSDKVEIVEGLSAGDEYVVMGQNKLTDGAAVERVEAQTQDHSPAKK
ncbi:MAG: efflux RND transporter periplasmic adaptor subunit [Kiritimatiellia bacterium]